MREAATSRRWLIRAGLPRDGGEPSPPPLTQDSLEAALKSVLQPVHEGLDTLKAAVSALSVSNGTLSSDVGTLNTTVSALSKDVGTLKTTVSALSKEFDTLNNTVGALKENMGGLVEVVAGGAVASQYSEPA